MNLIEIGQTFANDRAAGDFASAARLMHPKCVYIFGKQALIGREKIVETFKKVSAQASLDSIENGIRLTSQHGDELLIIENGFIVKIESRLLHNNI